MAKHRSAVLTCKCGATTHAGHVAEVDGGFGSHTYAGASTPPDEELPRQP